jgi:redox-sensitive bicupin YhaK (pirin superfamily)
LPTTAPILLADVAIDTNSTWPIPGTPARAVYVREGEVEIGASSIAAGQVAVLDAGHDSIRALSPARLLVFGGAPVGPRYSWWNYLHSSLDRIEAAKAEWRQGRVKLPSGDTESFTPAPPDEGRPLRHLNAP